MKAVFALSALFFVLYCFTKLIIYSDYDNPRYGRHFNRMLNRIKDAAKHKGDNFLIVTNKNNNFKIEVIDEKPQQGLQYSTIPRYSYSDVKINDEVVCRLHKLKSTLRTICIVEYSSKRRSYEIEELMNIAYKESKQIEKEYWKNFMSSLDTDDKSFYK